MSENTTEDTPLGIDNPPAEDQAPKRAEPAAMFDAPKDAPDELATGYAVYNRTLGRFVGGVQDKRPSKADASKAVPKGHTAAVVRV